MRIDTILLEYKRIFFIIENLIIDNIKEDKLSKTQFEFTILLTLVGNLVLNLYYSF